jgi:hypothetical protein
MSRRDIYYWKCDRPAAFHGTQSRGEADAEIEPQLRDALLRELDAKVVVLSPGAGQGNHLTWNAEVDGKAMFVRVENGPEKDDHLAIESALLDQVRSVGVVTPEVFGCDATRSRVPFAWQSLERISAPDLNHWFKQGTLEVPGIAFDIGVAVARWQQITFAGFGPVESSAVASQLPQRTPVAKQLDYFNAPHPRYTDYFHLRLDEHLTFLVSRGFLTATQRDEIAAEIENHRALLDLPKAASSTKTSHSGTSSALAIKSPPSSTSTTPSAEVRWMTSHCSPASTMLHSFKEPSRAMKASVPCRRIISAASGCISCGT